MQSYKARSEEYIYRSATDSGLFHAHFRVYSVLIIEDPTVTGMCSFNLICL